MLTKLHIQRFRLFNELKITGLSRVNLVVGPNNAGKTALLEAVQVYASQADYRTVMQMIEAREESLSLSSTTDAEVIQTAFRHLFSNHKIPNPHEPGIMFEGEGSLASSLTISTAAFITDEDEEGNLRKFELTKKGYLEADDTEIDIYMVAKKDNVTLERFPLDNNFRRLRNIPRRRNFYDPGAGLISGASIQFVSAQGMDKRHIASLWDAVSLTDLEPEVVNGLQLIEPNLSGLKFVEDPALRNPERTAVVKIQGINEPLPLKSLGDGASRILHILLCLVNARDGFLLIDEFENGLHWSVQPKVWKIIFSLAERLNVQIFATTHSRDCISAFDQNWNKEDNLGSFLRLDTKQGNVTAKQYNSETLTDALETQVEVR